MRGKKTPEETQEKIKEMRREGYSYQEIADEMDISKAVAYRYGKSIEVLPDVKRKKGTPGRDIGPSIVYKSGRIQVKAPKTTEALEELEEIIDFWKGRIKEE